MHDTKPVEDIVERTVHLLRERLSYLEPEERVRVLKYLQDWCAMENDRLRREVPAA